MNRILTTILSLLMAGALFGQNYSWQTPQAKILSNGDLEWAPMPYQFNPGSDIRYIDYEQGDDNNSGKSTQQAWKHHPWDDNAGGNAANASGVLTYVFKGGVVYRGQLEADESGQTDNPIRLLWDTNWGEGKPMIWGSQRLPSNWINATKVDHPERMPEPEKVWALNLKDVGIEIDSEDGVFFNIINPNTESRTLDESYTALHLVNKDGSVTQIHLARTPDWQPMGEDFAMDYWHTVDAEVQFEVEGSKRPAIGFKDDLWANKGLPEDYFEDGFIWMGWRHLMGTPTPRKMPLKLENSNNLPFFRPEEGIIMHAKQHGHGDGGLPYMLENLPQFLDNENEFYLDSESGLLFLRLAEGTNPNDLQLEFTSDMGSIKIENQENIEIGGIAFSFAQGRTIELLHRVKNLNIHHCSFSNVLDMAIEGTQSARAQADSVMDEIRIADSEFTNIGTRAIFINGMWLWNNPEHRGKLIEIDVLRNRTYNTGIRQRGARYTNVGAITIDAVQIAEIAGNIVQRSLGSGIVVVGGKSGSVGNDDARNSDIPLIRILMHHNKTEDTALGVNDYGGFALWQGGPTYAYNNNIGHSPGHVPAGFMGVKRAVNLSYPLYLDGAFKQYSFNNIIWGRSIDPKDKFANTTPAYFMVFGFLNQFFGNTIYNQASGIGGSSGNRNDIVSNLFANIGDNFIESNRIGSPSLVGGGDDAASGLRGIPSLAYSRNLFHGKAKAGYLVREREMNASDFLNKMIQADGISELQQQMQNFPLRVGSLGQKVEAKPIIGHTKSGSIENISEVDFHPVDNSPAIDQGGIYFVPWSLYATVGEWNFTENHAAPDTIVDYHWYMSESHYTRKMYEQIPSYDLTLNKASIDVYTDAPSEDWAKSAVVFDGSVYATVSDEDMRNDLVLSISDIFGSTRRDVPMPLEPWTVNKEEDYLSYPADKRKTPIIRTENMLIESIFKAEPDSSGVIANKHDGKNGYALQITQEGYAQFIISSNGDSSIVTSASTVNDGSWHHVIAEVDRQSGTMNIYVDGSLSETTTASLPQGTSIDTRADLVVGKAAFAESGYLTGAIDFLRICRGTLEDAKTTIDELYEWQTDGPFRYDFMGTKPKGRRDIGAIEAL